MSKHTPGPWAHTGNGDITGIEDNGFGRGSVDVCSVYLRTVKGRTEANARLIAAAPDLLEALKGALEHWPVPSSICKDRPAYEAARAAIKKAGGEL